VFIADTANHTLGRKLAQALDGKDTIDVRIGVPVIVMSMAHHQRTGTHIAGDETP
jgi:hypothetical protein